MQARNPLFCEEDLDIQLRDRQQRVSSIVDGIPKDQFLISTDEELVQHIIPQLAVEPIDLDEGGKSMNQQETKVDVSHDFGRAILDYNRNHPVYVNGTRIDIDIPFTGEAWIFQYRTNPHFLNIPYANVHTNFLRITVELPCDTKPTSFKSNYEK